MTRNGTLKSVAMPQYIDTGTSLGPHVRLITGSVVSMAVAPAAAMGASVPNSLTSSGAPSSAIISRTMFESRAMVPSSVPGSR